MSTSSSTSSLILSKATSAAEAVSPYAPDRRRRGRDTVADAPLAAASSTGHITSRLYTHCRRLTKVAALCLALGILRTLYERRRGRRRGVAAAESSSEDEEDDEDNNGNYSVTFIPTDIGGMREALSLLVHRLVEIPSVVRRVGWPWSSFSSQIFFDRCRSLLTITADGREGRAGGGSGGIQFDGDCATTRDDDHNLDPSRSPSAWRGVERVEKEQESPTPPPPPRHRSDVDSVLNFWYASSPSKSQKSLWMITDPAKLESTDAMISFEFGSLFTRLVDSSCLRDEWSSASHYGYEGTLALILILDQFSRHILRRHARVTKCCDGGRDGEGESSSKETCRLPSQGECDALALSAARHFHATFHDQIDSGRIPTVCRVFALLPYRHSGTLEDLKFVQSCVEDEMEVMGGEEAALLRRFRSATNRRMNVLLDEARRTTRTTATVKTIAMTNATVVSSETSNGRDSGHDRGPDAAVAFADDDILECFPREAPLTPEELVEAGSHPVVNVIRTFLLERGLRPVDSSSASGVGSERLRRGRGRPRPRPRSRPRSRRGKTGVGGAGRDSGEEVDVGSSAETTLRSSSPETGGEKREDVEKVCGHDDGNDAVGPVRCDEVPSPMLESVFGTGRGGGGTERGGDNPSTNACNSNACNSETQRALFSHSPLTPIIVSLSGGVDSMVIARALALLSDPSSPTYTFSIRIVGAHIDYANRPESVAEADYVARYCDAIGMKYRVRRIDEVTRGVTARDEYERVARAARYDFYRRILEEEEEAMESCSDAVTGTGGRGEGGDVRDDGSGRPVGIVLGHHRGDLRENVLSNACRGCGPLDLSGMTEVGTVEGVEVWRPLLPLEKDQVYDFAHRFGVPYFKDTTPLWSTRGKLRNRLLPLIQEVYGEGSMTNLSSLATESDSARALLLDSVLRPFLDEVRRRPMGVSFPTSSPWKERGPFFWRFVLRDVLHSVGRGIFSDGALASFLGRVGAHPVRPGWLQCRRDYAVYLDADGTVHVFHPETFPWAKDDQYDCAGQAIQLGRDNALQIGSWTVSAEEEQDITRVKASALLSQKAYLSMDDLMEGQLTYFLKVPRNCTAGPPLVVVKGFTRASRPHAWKSTDSRIQSTLPLVGNTDAAIERLDAEFSFQNSMIVRVDLTINGISMG